jgi:uncharacterized MAPEG superfamily protein
VGVGDYVVNSLEVSLPVPDRAGEALDFTGRWGGERQPQRHPVRDGLWLRENRRGKTGFDAPSTTGHPDLERAMRVHYNTLEQMPIILPLLWLSTIYFHMLAWLPAAFGLIWLVGRVVYWQGYIADPAKRSMGFLIGSVAVLGLLVLSIVGIVQGFLVTTA